MISTRAKAAEHSKKARHNAIRELLVKTAVANQDVLRSKLANRGIHVAQATLSRDIRQLRLLKGAAGYELPDGGSPNEAADRPNTLRNFCLEVRQAQSLLVLLTTNGGAQPVAAAIDGYEWNGVAGTIAGDNTVLVICMDIDLAQSVNRRIEALLR